MKDALTSADIARNVARDLTPGSYVNVGVGLPTLVPAAMPKGHNVVFHSENGLLGIGEDAVDGATQIINAALEPVEIAPGGSFTSHNEAFIIIRGGHLDLALLGAFEVSACGDLANWLLPSEGGLPAIGGAMDLAAGVKDVWVLMHHMRPDGTPKIRDQCRLPITGRGIVSRIYTDLAILSVAHCGLIVEAMIEGFSFGELCGVTAAPLKLRSPCQCLRRVAQSHSLQQGMTA